MARIAAAVLRVVEAVCAPGERIERQQGVVCEGGQARRHGLFPASKAI
jgi:hypothetical protein